MVMPPGLLRNSLRMAPSATAWTGLPAGSMMSAASCMWPLCVSVKVSRTSAGLMPAMGEDSGGMKESWQSASAASSGINNEIRTRTSLFQNGRRAGMNHTCEIEGIPVGQADAASGCSVANAAGIRSAVNAVMCFRKAHPDSPRGIARTGRKFSGSSIGAGVPEVDGIVIKPRVAIDAEDLPGADGKRVMFAADGGWVFGNDFVAHAIGGDCAFGFRDDDACNTCRRMRRNVGDIQYFAGHIEMLAGIKFGEEFGCGVELFAEFFLSGFVAHVLHLGLFLNVFGNGSEGTFHIERS